MGRPHALMRVGFPLNGLAGPEYHAIISFGLPFESEDSQYGEYRTKATEIEFWIQFRLLESGFLSKYMPHPRSAKLHLDTLHLATLP